jgi:hypothetical protein
MSTGLSVQPDTIKRPTHPQLISSGTTLAKGEGAQGSSQGKTSKKLKHQAW